MAIRIISVITQVLHPTVIKNLKGLNFDPDFY